MKRFKCEETCFREELALGTRTTEDLYAGHEHTKMAAMPDPLLDIKQEKQEPHVCRNQWLARIEAYLKNNYYTRKLV